jgi:Domain of unknown function (DUF4307)
VTRPAGLDERYGTGPRARRRWGAVAAGLVAAGFLGWLAWATWAQATPQVQSDLSSFEVVDDHAVDVRVSVSLDEGVEASCVVSALAADHSTVGQLTFAPTDGTQTVRVRTERPATAVELIGCTAPGQSRPR